MIVRRHLKVDHSTVKYNLYYSQRILTKRTFKINITERKAIVWIAFREGISHCQIAHLQAFEALQELVDARERNSESISVDLPIWKLQKEKVPLENVFSTEVSLFLWYLKKWKMKALFPISFRKYFFP